MRLTRLVRALGLSLALGVLGSVVGCGPASQQAALDQVDEDGMLVSRKEIRSHNKKLRESKVNPGSPKGGRSGVKAGP